MTAPELQAFEKEMEMGCHAFQTQYTPAYGYVPSLAAGIVFVVLFGIPLLYHVFQSCRVRRATSILLSLGAVSTYTHTTASQPASQPLLDLILLPEPVDSDG